MATIETLNGPLDTSELGTVLMHEHVFNLTAEIQMVHPGFNGWDPDVHVPAAQEELRGVKEAGIDTIVDGQPLASARQAPPDYPNSALTDEALAPCREAVHAHSASRRDLPIPRGPRRIVMTVPNS